MKQNGKDLVSLSAEMKTKNVELKRFLFKNLYRHYRVERMAEKAKRVISMLFEAYKSNFNTIPNSFKIGYSSAEPQERIICDYIAGMTDRFALEEYARFFDPFSKV